VWASLADGTPLVTAEKRGKGLIVLFHVTANADWSNLPLSGMFVEMLRRVLDLAPGAGGGAAAGQSGNESDAAAFVPRRTLNGAGAPTDPAPDAAPVAASEIDRVGPSPAHPAGLYMRGAFERAINLAVGGDRLAAIGDLPSAATVRGLALAPTIPLAPILFTAAFLVFLADCLIALWLSNSWQKLRMRSAGAAILLVVLMAAFPGGVLAQSPESDQFALANTLKTRLAYVATGRREGRHTH